MSSCPPAGFVSPKAETVMVATRGILNLTHIIETPTSATHIHYQAFVLTKGDDGAFEVFYPPLINTTLKWDVEAPFGPPSPDNVPALPAWLPIDKRCSSATAIYDLQSLPDSLLKGREAITNYIAADWYFMRISDGAFTESNHLESSTFIVLKPAAAPPPPPTSPNASAVTSPTPSWTDATNTTLSGETAPESAEQSHGISAEAALALQISIPLLVVIGMASALWAWWRRRKVPEKGAEVPEHHMAQDTDATKRFEKPELDGTSVQPRELEQHNHIAEAVNDQNNQHGDGLGGTGHAGKGRIMSFELEAPLYTGSSVPRA